MIAVLAVLILLSFLLFFSTRKIRFQPFVARSLVRRVRIGHSGAYALPDKDGTFKYEIVVQRPKRAGDVITIEKAHHKRAAFAYLTPRNLFDVTSRHAIIRLHKSAANTVLIAALKNGALVWTASAGVGTAANKLSSSDISATEIVDAIKMLADNAFGGEVAEAVDTGVEALKSIFEFLGIDSVETVASMDPTLLLNDIQGIVQSSLTAQANVTMLTNIRLVMSTVQMSISSAYIVQKELFGYNSQYPTGDPNLVGTVTQGTQTVAKRTVLKNLLVGYLGAGAGGLSLDSSIIALISGAVPGTPAVLNWAAFTPTGGVQTVFGLGNNFLTLAFLLTLFISVRREQAIVDDVATAGNYGNPWTSQFLTLMQASSGTINQGIMACYYMWCSTKFKTLQNLVVANFSFSIPLTFPVIDHITCPDSLVDLNTSLPAVITQYEPSGPCISSLDGSTREVACSATTLNCNGVSATSEDPRIARLMDLDTFFGSFEAFMGSLMSNVGLVSLATANGYSFSLLNMAPPVLSPTPTAPSNWPSGQPIPLGTPFGTSVGTVTALAANFYCTSSATYNGTTTVAGTGPLFGVNDDNGFICLNNGMTKNTQLPSGGTAFFNSTTLPFILTNPSTVGCASFDPFKAWWAKTNALVSCMTAGALTVPGTTAGVATVNSRQAMCGQYATTTDSTGAVTSSTGFLKGAASTRCDPV